MSVLLSLFLALLLAFTKGTQGGVGGRRECIGLAGWIRCIGMGAIVIGKGIKLTLCVYAARCGIATATHQISVVLILLITGRTGSVLKAASSKSVTLSKRQVTADWGSSGRLKTWRRSLNIAGVELAMRLLRAERSIGCRGHHRRLLVHEFRIGHWLDSSRG